MNEQEKVEPVVTCDSIGRAVCVSMQDAEGRIVKVIWEAPTTPQSCGRCAEWGKMWDELNEQTGAEIARLTKEVDWFNSQSEILLSNINEREATIAQQAERIGMLEISLETRSEHLRQCESALAERDTTVMQQAAAEKLLEKCRPSVKADLIQWEQLVERKRKAGSLNQCDEDYTQGIFNLLEAIDIAAHRKGEK